jgi:hypothetical protein
MTTQTDPRKVERYWHLRSRGFQVTPAAREAGFSYATARRLELGQHVLSDNPEERKKLRASRQAPQPIPHDELKPEALAALSDFGLFQRRYLGRVASPWQVELANVVVKAFERGRETGEVQYLVVNAPPGVGKSTTNTLDIPLWLICRNRAIRGATFSNTQTAANRYVLAIKRVLERTLPVRGDPAKVAAGLELDALATLADDYGTFKPEQRDVWSRSEFVVAQMGGFPIEEKESTWTAFGFDSQYLGMRLDFMVADDVVDNKSIRTLETIDKQRTDWNTVAENRVDPGGVLLLQGQRLGTNDLYAYCRDKPAGIDEEDDENPVRQRRMYQHTVFKAHYDDRCEGVHRPAVAKPYPDGCLLDPRRMPWTKISSAKQGDSYTYYIVLQQEDMDPRDTLVKKSWVYGGTDPDTGEMLPGCLDRDRDICELPKNLAGRLVSYATVDPSAARWWCVQWWVCRTENGEPHERYLMDLDRRKMMAPDLLDWHDSTRSFAGTMDAWQQRSVELGWPISHWIIERNGAQRYLLQYEHTKRWMAKWGVAVIPHETNVNKLDPDKGLQTLRSVWHFGLVRLPWKGNSTGTMATGGGHGYIRSMKLVDEVTHLPDHPTSDCAMAEWFGEFHLRKITPRASELPEEDRPSWLSGVNTYEWRRSLGAAS